VPVASRREVVLARPSVPVYEADRNRCERVERKPGRHRAGTVAADPVGDHGTVVTLFDRARFL